MLLPPPHPPTLFPYTTLFRSCVDSSCGPLRLRVPSGMRRRASMVGSWSNSFLCFLMNASQTWPPADGGGHVWEDRKSTRLNSSHLVISYAVVCLKKTN